MLKKFAIIIFFCSLLISIRVLAWDDIVKRGIGSGGGPLYGDLDFNGNDIIDVSNIKWEQATTDIATTNLLISAQDAYEKATGANQAGANTITRAGMGTRQITIDNWNNCALDTVSVKVNYSPSQVLTEGTQWTASVDNATTAISLASAVNALSGVDAYASGAVVYITATDLTTYSTWLGESDATCTTITMGTDGENRIGGDLTPTQSNDFTLGTASRIWSSIHTTYSNFYATLEASGGASIGWGYKTRMTSPVNGDLNIHVYDNTQGFNLDAHSTPDTMTVRNHADNAYGYLVCNGGVMHDDLAINNPGHIVIGDNVASSDDSFLVKNGPSGATPHMIQTTGGIQVTSGTANMAAVEFGSTVNINSAGVHPIVAQLTLGEAGIVLNSGSCTTSAILNFKPGIATECGSNFSIYDNSGGVAYFGGGITVANTSAVLTSGYTQNGNSSIGGNIYTAYGSNDTNAHMLKPDTTRDQMLFLFGAGQGRHTVIGETSFWNGIDYDHPTTDDPTVFWHDSTSPDTDNSICSRQDYNSLSACEKTQDAAPNDYQIMAGSAYEQASSNKTGADLYLTAGRGKKLVQIVNYSNVVGPDYLAIYCGGTEYKYTEGSEFNCITSNDVCATNLAAAINGTSGFTSTSSGAYVYTVIDQDIMGSCFIISSDDTNMDATDNIDGQVILSFDNGNFAKFGAGAATALPMFFICNRTGGDCGGFSYQSNVIRFYRDDRSTPLNITADSFSDWQTDYMLDSDALKTDNDFEYQWSEDGAHSGTKDTGLKRTAVGWASFTNGAGSATGGLDQGSGKLEFPNGTALPAACNVGEIFADTDSDDCSNTGGGDGCLCICKSSNTWAIILDY